jgi:hypothetical protein
MGLRRLSVLWISMIENWSSDPGSVPRKVMWDLWWIKWYWGRYSPNTSVSPANSHSTNCSIFIKHAARIIDAVCSVDTDSVVKYWRKKRTENRKCPTIFHERLPYLYKRYSYLETLHIVAYLLKARTVEAEKQSLLDNGPYIAQERVT